jgi:hypothetical protein
MNRLYAYSIAGSMGWWNYGGPEGQAPGAYCWPGLGAALAHCGLVRSNDLRAAEAMEAI